MNSGKAPSPLLSGIERARRPSGPVLALIVVVLCLLVGQTLGALLFSTAFGVTPGQLLDAGLGLSEQLVSTLSFAGALALLLGWVYWKERRSFASLGFRRARMGSGLLLGSVLALVLVSVPILLGDLFGQFEIRGAVFDPARTGGVLLALVGFAVQGSTEEILVRGYLMQSVSRKWGLIAAIVVQALVFTALHGANTGISGIALLNLVLIAVLFGFWALAEGGLWGVCAFHVVWNWCQGNVYGIQVSGLDVDTTWFSFDPSAGSTGLLTGGGFGVEGSLLTTAVLVIGAIVAALAYRRGTDRRLAIGEA